MESDHTISALLTKEYALHYRIVPESLNNGVLTLLVDDQQDLYSLGNELEVILDRQLNLKPVDADKITFLIGQYYPQESGKRQFNKQTKALEGESFLNDLIVEAKSLKSSDIHIEIYEESCRVRMRIDGMMVERYVLKKNDYPALINKIKIMANLDIAEKRLPQDGRINFRTASEQFDIRVSVLPTLHGEKVVLRLLNNNAADIDINKVGFSEFDLTNYLQGVKRPNGIILISGPTGSGKTTTLYATLKFLNMETRNILTIEDPIEYTLKGINQVQLKESIGLTFAAALRTFLRQDPDVIMVGEIRDTETANMAIRAALTGHLVLSTVHTNSAWGTISRLIDMGIPAFLVANTLNTTVAQRLIRLLCKSCKEKRSFDTSLYPKQFVTEKLIETHYIAKGCELCYNTGYSGRKAVYEVIPLDHELSQDIKTGNLNIKDKLSDRGIKTMGENAFMIFENGDTTIEEIYPLLFNH